MGSSPFNCTKKWLCQFDICHFFCTLHSIRDLNGWESQTLGQTFVVCLRQMMDTHQLPPRRDSEAEQVPSTAPKHRVYSRCFFVVGLCAFSTTLRVWTHTVWLALALLCKHNLSLLRSLRSLQVPSTAPIDKQRFDTKVLNLFSLHKGSWFLSVSKQQSLVGVFNRTFARLFFFIYNNYGTKGLSTERKFHLRNDRYCYGTIDFC